MQVLVNHATGAAQFEEVLMFSHKEVASVNDYMTVHTQGNRSITANDGHYIWVAKKCHLPLVITAVAQVELGDVVMVTTGSQPLSNWPWQLEAVTAITRSMQVGLYNPHTRSGSIVVDNVSALTFTSSIPASLGLHQALMAPVQGLHMLLPDTRLILINDVLMSVFFKSTALVGGIPGAIVPAAMMASMQLSAWWALI